MRGRSERGGAGMLVLLVILLPMGLLVLPSSLLALAGMVPSFVAYGVDRHDDKAAALTVGALNICGVMPFLIQLWQHGHTLVYALSLLNQPVTWMIMYSAAAVGWLLYFAIPPLVAGWSASRDEAKARGLERKREALVDLWGPEVAEALKPMADEPMAGDREDNGSAATGQDATGQDRDPT